MAQNLAAEDSGFTADLTKEVLPEENLGFLRDYKLLRKLGHGGMGMVYLVKDIKLVVDKNEEIPATVVLRDNDLGLAFLRPTEKREKPFKYIDFTNSVQPQLLEQVMVLARMGRIADRQIGAMTGEIQAIVTKPRLFYVPSAELASGGFGVPIFSEAKKVVGLVLMRTLPSAASADSDDGMLGIILPASDIVEIADQAKAPEKK